MTTLTIPNPPKPNTVPYLVHILQNDLIDFRRIANLPPELVKLYAAQCHETLIAGDELERGGWRLSWDLWLNEYRYGGFMILSYELCRQLDDPLMQALHDSFMHHLMSVTLAALRGPGPQLVNPRIPLHPEGFYH